MNVKTLTNAWINAGHPSPLVAEFWTLGEFAIARTLGDSCYGLLDAAGEAVGAYTHLEDAKERGATLWAAKIAEKFQAQQEPAHEDGDVQVSDQGSIILFRPITQAAKDWIERNVDEGAQWLGSRLAVESRFAPYLIEGMVGSGLAFG